MCVCVCVFVCVCVCLCVLALSSVICRPIYLLNASCGFQKFKSADQKMFKQNIYLGKTLTVTVVFFVLFLLFFCCGHASLKRERIFH